MLLCADKVDQKVGGSICSTIMISSSSACSHLSSFVGIHQPPASLQVASAYWRYSRSLPIIITAIMIESYYVVVRCRNHQQPGTSCRGAKRKHRSSSSSIILSLDLLSPQLMNAILLPAARIRTNKSYFNKSSPLLAAAAAAVVTEEERRNDKYCCCWHDVRERYR